MYFRETDLEAALWSFPPDLPANYRIVHWHGLSCCALRFSCHCVLCSVAPVTPPGGLGESLLSVCFDDSLLFTSLGLDGCVFIVILLRRQFLALTSVDEYLFIQTLSYVVSADSFDAHFSSSSPSGLGLGISSPTPCREVSVLP